MSGLPALDDGMIPRTGDAAAKAPGYEAHKSFPVTDRFVRLVSFLLIGFRIQEALLSGSHGSYHLFTGERKVSESGHWRGGQGQKRGMAGVLGVWQTVCSGQGGELP